MPDSQNKGIGTRVMQAIEENPSMADRYELFTGHRSARNLYPSNLIALFYSRVKPTFLL